MSGEGGHLKKKVTKDPSVDMSFSSTKKAADCLSINIDSFFGDFPALSHKVANPAPF